MRIGRRVAKVLILGPGALPVDPRRRALVRLHLRDRQRDAGRWIRQYAVRYLPGLGARPGPRPAWRLVDELTLHDTRIIQQVDGGAVPDAPHPLAEGPGEHPEAAPRRVRRARGRRGAAGAAALPAPDGTWNLQGLLADPWPGPWLARRRRSSSRRGPSSWSVAPTTRPGRPARPAETRVGRRRRPHRDAPPRREHQDRAGHVGGFLYRFEGSARAISWTASSSAGRSTWRPAR